MGNDFFEGLRDAEQAIKANVNARQAMLDATVNKCVDIDNPTEDVLEEFAKIQRDKQFADRLSAFNSIMGSIRVKPEPKPEPKGIIQKLKLFFSTP